MDNKVELNNFDLPYAASLELRQRQRLLEDGLNPIVSQPDEALNTRLAGLLAKKAQDKLDWN